MRRASLDVPTMASRRVMGIVRNQVTGNLYRVTIGNATVSASTFSASTIAPGTRVPIIWHPERRFWEIEVQAGVQSIACGDGDVLIYDSASGNFGPRLGPYWLSSSKGVCFLTESLAGDGTRGKVLITTDAGVTWSVGANIPTSGGISAAWFERETPGNNGNKIHLIQVNDPGSSANEDVRYANYNAANDTWSGVVELDSNHSFLSTTSVCFITVTRSGNIICGYADPNAGGNSGAWKSNDGGGSFLAIANPFETNAGDLVLGVSVNTGDSNDAGILFWDISADAVSVKMYDDSADTWTETAIASSMLDSTGFLRECMWQASTRLSDGHTLLAAWTRLDNIAADLKTWDLTLDSIASPTITAKTDVVTDQAEAGGVGLFIDQLTDAVYVAYFKGGTFITSVDVVYRVSTDGLATWSIETPVSEAAPSELRVVRGGVMGVGTYGGRFYPIWQDVGGAPDNIFYGHCVQAVP